MNLKGTDDAKKATPTMELVFAVVKESGEGYAQRGEFLPLSVWGSRVCGREVMVSIMPAMLGCSQTGCAVYVVFRGQDKTSCQ